MRIRTFFVVMVLRDRLTVIDVWFGFQVDGKLSLKMPNWPQFGAGKRFTSNWENIMAISRILWFYKAFDRPGMFAIVLSREKQQRCRVTCSTH